MGGAHKVMAKRKREVVDPLHVVDENQRRTDRAKRTVRGLKDPQRLKRYRFLPIVGKEQRLQPVRCRRHGGERQQKIGGCCERHFAFRLVTNDAEPVRQRRLSGRLCQQPALPAARIAHNDSSCDVPCGSGTGAANIVKVKALPLSARGTNRVAKSLSASSRGPASMSITPDSRSAWIS